MAVQEWVQSYVDTDGVTRVPFPKKPTTRSACQGYARPCPFVSCRYHLFLDVTRERIKEYAEDPLEMEETCALDLADRGGMHLEEIMDYFDLSRERIRQIVENALRKMRFRRC